MRAFALVLILVLSQLAWALPASRPGTTDWGPAARSQQVVSAEDERLRTWLLAAPRLEIRRADGTVKPCSAVPLEGGLVATCNHCIISQEECSRARIQFFDEDGRLDAETPCRAFEASRRLRDISFVSVADSALVMRHGFRLAAERARPGTEAVLIGYPLARGRERTLSTCRVLEPWVETAADLYHNCRSSDGNSGGPLVHRATGEVIGLHCGGNKRRRYGYGARSDLVLEALRAGGHSDY